MPHELAVTIGSDQADGTFSGSSVRLAPDGAFTVRNLRPGLYLLEAAPPREPAGNPPGFEGGEVAVMVADADVTGVTITTHPTTTVHGTLRFESDEPAARPDVVVHAMLALTGIAWVRRSRRGLPKAASSCCTTCMVRG